MDYRKFLRGTDVETRVLPYFGGTRVDAKDRRYRLTSDAALAPGWQRFQIDGREAVPQGAAPPPDDLEALPAVRGHYVAGWVVVDGRERVSLAIGPDDEPPVLARVTARRWFGGEHVFGSVDFEDAAETDARAALEARRALGADVKGVAPSLRVAYGCALGLATAAAIELPTSVPELFAIALEIAEGGPQVLHVLYEEVIAEREAQRVAAEARAAALRRAVVLDNAVRKAKVVARDRRPQRAADDALAAAHARLVECRMLQRGAAMDVIYVVDGVRIISTVDPETLQVMDAGICLSGSDRVLTLDAMPSVVREAVQARHLNITRRS